MLHLHHCALPLGCVLSAVVFVMRYAGRVSQYYFPLKLWRPVRSSYVSTCSACGAGCLAGAAWKVLPSTLRHWTPPLPDGCCAGAGRPWFYRGAVVADGWPWVCFLTGNRTYSETQLCRHRVARHTLTPSLLRLLPFGLPIHRTPTDKQLRDVKLY